jgi:hypothetical protein
MDKVKFISSSLRRIMNTLSSVGLFGFIVIFLNYILPILLSLTHGNHALGMFSIFKNEINLLMAVGMLGVFHFLVPISGKFKLSRKIVFIILVHILAVGVVFSLYKRDFNFDLGFFLILSSTITYLILNFIRSIIVRYINYSKLIYISYGAFVWLLLFSLIFGVNHVEDIYIYSILACLVVIASMAPYLLRVVDDYFQLEKVNRNTALIYFESLPYVIKEVFQLIILFSIFKAVEKAGGVVEVGYLSALLLYPSLVGFLIITLAPKMVSNISIGFENSRYYFLDNILFTSLIAGFLFVLLYIFNLLELNVTFEFLPRNFSHIILIIFISFFDALKGLFVGYLYGSKLQNIVAFSEFLPFSAVIIYLHFFDLSSTSNALALIFFNIIIFLLLAVTIFFYLRSRRD